MINRIILLVAVRDLYHMDFIFLSAGHFKRSHAILIRNSRFIDLGFVPIEYLIKST